LAGSRQAVLGKAENFDLSHLGLADTSHGLQAPGDAAHARPPQERAVSARENEDRPGLPTE
jgi:hypothetical protein